MSDAEFARLVAGIVLDGLIGDDGSGFYWLAASGAGVLCVAHVLVDR